MQHRLALVDVHRPDQLDELRDVLHRDPGHRLVEQDHARVAGEHHRELELALVAVGERTRPATAARAEPDAVERPRRLLDRAHGRRARAARSASSRRAPPRRRAATFSSTVRQREDVRDLERPPEAPRVRRNGGCRVMSRAGELDRARTVGRQRPGEEVEERRLAGAVRADDPEQLALGNLEPDTGDDGRPSDVEPEVPRREDRGDALTRECAACVYPLASARRAAPWRTAVAVPSDVAARGWPFFETSLHPEHRLQHRVVLRPDRLDALRREELLALERGDHLVDVAPPPVFWSAWHDHLRHRRSRPA